MLPQLKFLLDLQKIDQEIHELRDRLDSLRPMAIAVQQRLKDESAQVTTLEEELFDIKKNQDLLNLDVQKKEADIERYKKQQPLVTKSKEIAALSYEIELAKANKEKFEIELAKLRNRREEIDNKLSELSGGMEEVRQSCEEEFAEIKKEAEEIKTRMKDLKSERGTYWDKLEDDLKEEYVELSKKFPGSVVSDVKDGACLGCNMNLIPQTHVELRLGKAIQHCHRCGRILGRDLDMTAATETESND